MANINRIIERRIFFDPKENLETVKRSRGKPNYITVTDTLRR